jgi:hypothetical protein
VFLRLWFREGRILIQLRVAASACSI